MEVLGVRLGRKMAKSLHHKTMSMWFSGTLEFGKKRMGIIDKSHLLSTY